MKRIILVLLLPLLLVGCQSKRSGSLSELIVGQWKNQTGDIEKCFDDKGVMVFNDIKRDVVVTYTYQVQQEKPAARILSLISISPKGESTASSYKISSDGKTAFLYYLGRDKNLVEAVEPVYHYVSADTSACNR